MSLRIRNIFAWEILDSRGNPTVAARCELSNGIAAKAHAPSGASTGRHEAVELRDGDLSRYAGKGVLKAVRNVNEVMAPALLGALAEGVDPFLQNDPELGANAMVAVSCAAARAFALAENVPLWRYLAAGRIPRMPVPMVNILSGGLHAGRNLEFQDFLVVPNGIKDYGRQLEAIVAVHRAARLVLERHGCVLTGVADEGGWGPRLDTNEKAIELLTDAIELAGFRSGEDVSIALDVASSHFFSGDAYELPTESRSLTAAGMVDLLTDWSARYPIVSIEDGLAEDDWAGWQLLTARLGSSLQLVGDDLFTTNLERLERGIETGAGNAVLVKMNQIGTLAQTFEVIDRAREAGFRAVISARSGETEDDFLADLAVASGAGQIKVGSITRSERLAKYNRLFEIERELRG